MRPFILVVLVFLILIHSQVSAADVDEPRKAPFQICLKHYLLLTGGVGTAAGLIGLGLKELWSNHPGIGYDDDDPEEERFLALLKINGVTPRIADALRWIESRDVSPTVRNEATILLNGGPETQWDKKLERYRSYLGRPILMEYDSSAKPDRRFQGLKNTLKRAINDKENRFMDIVAQLDPHWEVRWEIPKIKKLHKFGNHPEIHYDISHSEGKIQLDLLKLHSEQLTPEQIRALQEVVNETLPGYDEAKEVLVLFGIGDHPDIGYYRSGDEGDRRKAILKLNSTPIKPEHLAALHKIKESSIYLLEGTAAREVLALHSIGDQPSLGYFRKDSHDVRRDALWERRGNDFSPTELNVLEKIKKEDPDQGLFDHVEEIAEKVLALHAIGDHPEFDYYRKNTNLERMEAIEQLNSRSISPTQLETLKTIIESNSTLPERPTAKEVLALHSIGDHPSLGYYRKDPNDVRKDALWERRGKNFSKEEVSILRKIKEKDPDQGFFDTVQRTAEKILALHSIGDHPDINYYRQDADYERDKKLNTLNSALLNEKQLIALRKIAQNVDLLEHSTAKTILALHEIGDHPSLAYYRSDDSDTRAQAIKALSIRKFSASEKAALRAIAKQDPEHRVRWAAENVLEQIEKPKQ